MIISLTNQNITDDEYSVVWSGDDVLVTHGLDGDVICQCYNDNDRLIYLDAEIVDSNNLRLNFVGGIPPGVRYRLLIKKIVSYHLTGSDGASENVSSTWEEDGVLITHNLSSGVYVQLWNAANQLVHLPIYIINTQSFWIDFSGTSKPTEVGYWRVVFHAVSTISVGLSNGSSTGFTWSWSGNVLTVNHEFGIYPFVQLYDDTSELVGIEAETAGDGVFHFPFDDISKPPVGETYDILFGDADEEIALATQYYSSGRPHINFHTDEIRELLVPSIGSWRQYFMMDEQGDILGDGVLYQFQVASDYNFVFKIFDEVQDSILVEGNPSYQHGDLENKGNIFYVPSGQELPRVGRYFWRVRVSHKMESGGELIWFDWSPRFAFFVNKPPLAPDEIAIVSGV